MFPVGKREAAFEFQRGVFSIYEEAIPVGIRTVVLVVEIYHL